MVNPLFVDAGITKEIGPVSEDRTDRGIRRVEVMASEDPQEMVADLFERYHAAIFAYLYRLSGDRESANGLREHLSNPAGQPCRLRCCRLSNLVLDYVICGHWSPIFQVWPRASWL